MLKREFVRRYLMALLKSQDVPQGPDCETGPLWDNCDGDVKVFDSGTHQLFEDAEGSIGLAADCLGVVFRIGEVRYTASQTCIQETEIPVVIHLVVHARNGKARQNILDKVEERILYRLFSHADFTDTAGTIHRSIMRMIDGNALQIGTIDESIFDGNFTLREITMTFTTKDCVQKDNCSDVVLCMDFDNLTRLDKEGEDIQL